MLLQEEAGKSGISERRKDPRVRRVEILGSGEGSLGACMLAEAGEKLREYLTSSTAGDWVVELALGGSDGMRQTFEGRDTYWLKSIFKEGLQAPCRRMEDRKLERVSKSPQLQSKWIPPP